QVTRERDLEAARHGEALDRGDQRLARGALDDAGEAAVADPGALPGDERLEVHAGREALARAGEHADLELLGVVELVEGVGDPLGEIAVDRVARLRPVERD